MGLIRYYYRSRYCQTGIDRLLYEGPSETTATMDRQAILDKIAAMLRLQEATGFDGESAAAATMIDKLCAKYGVTVSEANTPKVLTEEYKSTGRLNEAEFLLFTAVARFYDAKGFVQYSYPNGGRKVSTFKCIGTEAQQIQTKLYFDFFVETMANECEKTMKGEEILADLTGSSFNRSGFKTNFYKAFAMKVQERLDELKKEKGDHEHKEVTNIVIASMKFGTRKVAATGLGLMMGSNAGENASLHRQATGS